MQRLGSDVEDLQEKLDNDAVEEGKLDALKEGLEEAKEELSTHQASFSDSVIARDKAMETLKTIKERKDAIDVEAAEIKAKIHKAEIKKVKLSERREAALREKNRAFAAIEQSKHLREAAQVARDEIAETVTVFIREASKVCDRVPVDQGENCDSLDTKLKKLVHDLQSWEKR